MRARAVGTPLLLAAVAVLCLGSTPTAAAAAVQSPEPGVVVADPTPFQGDGMWIWYVSNASGGDPARIARRARAHGIETLYIKAGDGTDPWSQFTPALVGALHRRGLQVCAWHYVYGNDPKREASVSAGAVRRGADCLVIDAESQYEGRYAQASVYIERLRAAIGPDYPLGLAGFPYVQYHPAYPYSVFLGPGGAEFNLPQVYWRAIGDTVDEAIDTTYTYNRVYDRPIYPLGQLYMNPPAREVLRFRKLARATGFGGVSWWSWQDARPRGWRAVSRRRLSVPRGYRPTTSYPTLRAGSAGDLVIWAQEHLATGGYLSGPVSGEYGGSTRDAIRAFQAASGLPVTGVTDAATWEQLIERLDPKPVAWAGRAAPRSASLRPRSHELPRSPRR